MAQSGRNTGNYMYVQIKYNFNLITSETINWWIIALKPFASNRAVRMELNPQTVVRWVHIKRHVAIFRAVLSNWVSTTSNVYLYKIIITVGHVTLDVKGRPWQLDSKTKTYSDVILTVQVVGVRRTSWKWWWWYCSSRRN